LKEENDDWGLEVQRDNSGFDGLWGGVMGKVYIQ